MLEIIEFNFLHLNWLSVVLEKLWKSSVTVKQIFLLLILIFAGVFSSGATPVPIPNTEVKSTCGDGIAGSTLWESSTMPAFYFDPGFF